jgi:exosortase/archaeosortase family protein
MLFGVAVIAFPAPGRRKFWGVAAGAVILFCLNLARLISLYLTGKARVSWFYARHQEWWPALFIFAAVAMWLAWLQWARGWSPGHQHV